MRNSNARIVVGVILIFLGLFYFADNIFFLPFQLRHLLFSWPTILVIIGIVMLLNSRESHAGIVLILIGGALMIFRYYHIPFREVFREYWPVLLIVFGLLILLKPGKRNYPGGFNPHIINDEPPKNYKSDAKDKSEKGWENTSEFINELVIFNSIDRRIYTPNFKGGKITTIFGAADIDLRNAKLTAGRQVLNVEVFFGGLDIYVPRDWRVVLSVTSIFGAFDDERRISTDPGQDESKVLEIKGFVLFGGGDLKN
jgi:predicted membrane protein